MAKIEGLQKVIDALKNKAAKVSTSKSPSVTIGYSTSYALHVHEDLQATHSNGQAKFLEQPFREMSQTLASIVREALKQNKTLSQALLLAGLRLQRESQKLVPVRTGVLKNSAFTRLDE